MDIDGASIRTLVPAVPLPQGAAWKTDGTILFSRRTSEPILRISAQGGEVSQTTRLESPQQRSHSFPTFLPDGRHFLFYVTGSPEGRGVYIGQIDGLESRRILDADGPAVYAATGHLLFTREGKLLAQGFDPDRLAPRGAPFPIADDVAPETALSASAAGAIVYRTPPADSGRRQLVWFDRSGNEIDKVVYPDSAALGPSLSHDGRRNGVFRFMNGNMDIWSYGIDRRAWDRITFHSGDDIYPL